MASSTSGFVATLVPWTLELAWARRLCASASAALAVRTLSAACATSSPETAPSTAACCRRARSLRARQFGRGLSDLGAGLVDAREGGAYRADGLAELRLGGGKLGVGGRGVQVDQRLAAPHALGVVGVQRDDIARVARGDRDDIARDIGVVGAFAVAAQQRITAIGDKAKTDRRAEQQQAALACLALLLRLRRQRRGLRRPFGEFGDRLDRGCRVGLEVKGEVGHRIHLCGGVGRGEKPPPSATSSWIRWITPSASMFA